MNEYTDRVQRLLENLSDSSSSKLFSIIESELNTRITAVIQNKKVYGNEFYTSRIKIDGVVLCSEYNVLRANYSYLVFAVKIIKEKIRLEKMTYLYKNVVHSAVEGLTDNELKGVNEVFSILTENSSRIIISDISKKCGITRSVIISGLKKLECAGIIEMYSGGSQGTNIKLLYTGIKSIISKKRGD